MIKHYFKIALRNLARQKTLALINVFGLSVGLACFMLFLLYAVNEFSFDNFHIDKENIYRMYLHVAPIYGQEKKETCYLPIPLGPAIKQDFPEVKNYVRFRDTWEPFFVKADNRVARVKVQFADPQFFSVFSFKIIYGDRINPLANPNNIVITKDRALQLFGETNVVGKTVEIKVEDKFDPFIITAVTENIPTNSTITFNMLASFDYYTNTPGGKTGVDNWHRSGFQTYVQLRPGSKLATASDQLRKFRAKYYPDEEAAFKKDHQWTTAGSPLVYGLQPITQMHTDPNIPGGGVESIDPTNIWILLSIAFGVLLIACINFTTLAIGRSANRAREIGVRKVIGSGKRQLIVQFLAEALLLSLFSSGIGLLLARLVLPSFSILSGRELEFSFSQYPQMIWMIAGLVILVGLLAGAYPALILSGFRPIEVLKSKVRVGGSNIFTRSLVTLQFILSIALIISTVIILQQLKFMQNKNLGFNKENVVMVDAEGTDTRKNYPLFKHALASESSISAVGCAELGLGEGMGWNMSGFEYRGQHKNIYEYFVDGDYVRLMGFKLIAGRNFDPRIASDTMTAVIINEAMATDFGWTPGNAVDQEITGYSDRMIPEVIGVVKNFNFLSLSEPIRPQMFHQFHSYVPYKYFVKIKSGNPSIALDAIKRAWSSVVPELPLKYDFLDESLNRFYKSESRWGRIIGWAGAVSIFLACLGLFGLAALAAVNRTKEIGIRKVLGASLTDVVSLLSKEFLMLVIVALVIASPLNWFFMHRWLQDFAYRINISVYVYAATGIATIAIALVTVSLQATRVAIANPVKSLRTE